jgi:hypothetical protein
VELLIIAETAALLPYEGWELGHRVTPFKVTSVVINLLILAYLVARYLQKRAALHSQEACPSGTYRRVREPENEALTRPGRSS